jgi:chromosome segregation ATPase
MGEILANEFALPAGGIAGALAIIIVTLIKVRAQQRESQNNWAKEHMNTLTQERKEADERADKFLAELDAERQRRIEAETKASKLEGKEEILREQLTTAEAEVARLRAQLGPLGI